MLIEEMTPQANQDLLARARLGRLACCRRQQPYVVPFYFVYQEFSLYSFSTVGKKIEWMRENPLVCVEADELENQQKWASVIVSGYYEELLDTDEWRSEREFAWKLLQQFAGWWEPSFANPTLHSATRPPEPVFYRIRAVRITGRRGSADPL